MFKIYYKNIRNIELQEIKQFKKGSWLYVSNPTEKDIEKLVKKYGLEEGLIRDATDEYEVPRFEQEDGIIYIFTRHVYEINDKIYTAPLMIAISDSFVLTVCNNQSSPLQLFLNNKVEFNTTQKTKFLLRTLLLVNQEYKKYIHKINKQATNFSSKLEKIENKDIIKFVEYERTLNAFLAALVPSSIVFERIIYDNAIKLYEEDEDLAEDLSLSNGQLIEIAKSSIRHISNVREAYTTITSNNLNTRMKWLTSITVILTIPTIISSFYGMNVPLPLQNNALAYAWIGGITLLVVIILTLLFMYKKMF
ncbi:MAG: magnesium transporter CorA family protein [Patescibacteria group bacterium]